MCRDFTKGAKTGINTSQSMFSPIEYFERNFSLKLTIEFHGTCAIDIFEYIEPTIENEKTILTGPKIYKIHQNEKD